MPFELADRLKALPPYLFAELDRKKRKKIEEGVEVIDLGVGDPDLPTPEPVVEALKRAAENPQNHRYPSYEGMRAFREAVSDWYRRRFGVELDPEREVIALIGSKEGIAHFPLAFVNPGDVVLCPDPAYPVYRIGTLFAGGQPYAVPLKEENDFLPDLGSIPQEVVDRAKIIWINYPNNPTSADATEDFYRELVRWAKKNNIIVASDNAYSEIYTGDRRPISILQVEGSREVAIEFHSLSKTFNMTGWRIGMAVGNEELVKALGKVKTNIDSGQFNAVQEAGIEALRLPESEIDKIRAVYRERRRVMTEALKSIGLTPVRSEVTFYIWTKVPQGYTSAEFAEKLLDEAGVVCTPGNGFGEAGEGYFRISLTVPTEKLVEAARRIENLK
jgi:LL-diaminopimelate aminotransferase